MRCFKFYVLRLRRCLREVIDIIYMVKDTLCFSLYLNTLGFITFFRI